MPSRPGGADARRPAARAWRLARPGKAYPRCGCRVTGVDPSEGFVEAARYLSLRTAQQERVDFHVGSALALDFADACFDAVLLQHVAMNVADRPRL
ncbi:hypothetical protein GALL_264230 [mine drainage metagenome]|uniref:Methyltransferase type 11 domain-containing protein n=1 Tax=mine drainage metagenome TaxID=410659 RepID=A0A1J5R6M8_9ZZZZ